MSYVNLTNLTGTTISIAGGGAGTTTTGTYTYMPTYNKKLRDTRIVETSEGMLIEIVYEMIPNMLSYFGYNSPKTKMRKEIYGSLDGKLQLIKAIEGYENPGYYVDPEIEWEE